MTSPRPYVAAAAASVLAAVYFVPSASASPDSGATAQTARTTASAAAPAHAGKSLADTGAIDTKPYVVGGAAFLIAGAGLVFNATRRSRAALPPA